ncbi:MAG: hypothetical protein WD021_05170 [Rhodothermales bacterium]
MKDLFTEDDLRRIQEAVADAELRTSGEIVPFIVPRSESYEVAIWKGAGLAAGLALFAAMLVFHFYDGWGLGWLHTGWGTASLTLAAGLLGGAVGAFVPVVQRLLAGADAMARAVHRRAMKAFVEEEVFDTRDRTGILIFISLLEHRIEVHGDAGIHQQVSEDEWVDIVERISKGIRSGHLTDAIVEAIGMCGKLLERKGVEIRDDDDDELPNTLRTREGH